MKENLLKIINHYGIDKQLKYIHSEYFELDEAIIQFNWNDEIHNEKYAIECVAQEIADVMVMLKQFQYYYGIEDKQVEEVMNYKIDRQLERIKGEKNEIK